MQAEVPGSAGGEERLLSAITCNRTIPSPGSGWDFFLH